MCHHRRSEMADGASNKLISIKLEGDAVDPVLTLLDEVAQSLLGILDELEDVNLKLDELNTKKGS